jgi:hypothetical protein
MYSNVNKFNVLETGLFVLFYTLPFLALSQTTFEKSIGFESEEWGHSVLQTADSGYIICGYTDQFQFKYDDVYLIKTDELGNIIWTKNYGSSALEQGYSIKPTSDGGHILAAERYSPMYETIRAYLVRTDNYGDTIWTRKFAGSGNANARCAIETSDGGYAFCGVNESIEDRSPYLVKLDEYGEIIWEKTFTGPLNEWSYDMEQTTDGGYIICGGSEVEQFYDDFLIIRTDESGETIWTRNFGEPGYDAAHSILKSDLDGNYYAGGESWNTKDTTRFDFYIVKLNDQGDAIWEKRYGGNGSDFFGSMEYVDDGGIIACGWTNNPAQGGGTISLFSESILMAHYFGRKHSEEQAMTWGNQFIQLLIMDLS